MQWVSFSTSSGRGDLPWSEKLKTSFWETMQCITKECVNVVVMATVESLHLLGLQNSRRVIVCLSLIFCSLCCNRKISRIPTEEQNFHVEDLCRIVPSPKLACEECVEWEAQKDFWRNGIWHNSEQANDLQNGGCMWRRGGGGGRLMLPPGPEGFIFSVSRGAHRLEGSVKMKRRKRECSIIRGKFLRKQKR